MRKGMFSENVRIAFRSIRSNRVRSVLTMLIIAFGIMALVGILTSIDAIKGLLTNQFSTMGANSFSISSRGNTVVIGSNRYRARNYSYISYREAIEFRDKFTSPALVSVSFTASGLATIRYGEEKTNPNIGLSGVDENYLGVSGYEIEFGRNFSAQEVGSTRHLAVIGAEVASALFKGVVDPLGRDIVVGGLRMQVIGVLKSKGTSVVSGDNICLIPVTTARQYFARPNMSFSINVMPVDPATLDIVAGEAEGLFRQVRKLNPVDPSDFNVTKSDNIVELLLENIKYVTLAATIIGIITLFGAAVGLMNIMLVSVTERTREIGTRKALGAKPSTIRQQFLYESVIIGQMGGAIGIFLGIMIGFVISSALKSQFEIPWTWITLGIALCFIVGVVSGYFPAVKAASVDPIEALRYE
jgi:putative ABC transport system permease protein